MTDMNPAHHDGRGAETATCADSPGRVHRRRYPLTGRHVLVSPHRTQRPWQGAQEHLDDTPLPSHDPACYLCAGCNAAKSFVKTKVPV